MAAIFTYTQQMLGTSFKSFRSIFLLERCFSEAQLLQSLECCLMKLFVCGLSITPHWTGMNPNLRFSEPHVRYL